MKARQGFTLLEILIVIAIIAILAGIVLVGLGPALRTGGDARRVADLREIQQGLQLYYNKNGNFPPDLISLDASVGVTKLPKDPSTGNSYGYQQTSGGTGYVLGAQLQEPKGKSLENSYAGSETFPNITGTCADPKVYCVSF